MSGDRVQKATVLLALAGAAIIVLVLLGAVGWAWFCQRFGYEAAAIYRGYMIGWGAYLALVALMVAAYSGSPTLLEDAIGRRMASVIRKIKGGDRP